MKSIDKEKMCVSCEGRIPLDTQICPFCASNQNGPKIQNSLHAPIFQNQTLEDSLSSLYTPPYQGKRPQFGLMEDTPEEPSYEPETMYEEDPPMYKEVTEKPQMDPLMGATMDEEDLPKPSSLWATIFLCVGVNFLILGLMQLFFSKNGILRLEWNANYWLFFCLIGAPSLYFGYKKAKVLTG